MDCDCRKPKPKLVLDTAAKYRIDLSKSFMIGDKASDVDCGRNAKVAGSFLVGTGYGPEEKKKFPDASSFYFSTFGDAVERILATRK
jgi:D-glycero-D-manno-heptose 1,7-bisphosphate phosphatase